MSPVSPRVPSFLKQGAADDDYEHEALKKRAAIMEFDGGMTRADVEASALALLGLAASNQPRKSTWPGNRARSQRPASQRPRRWRWRVFPIHRTRMLPTHSRSAIKSAYPRTRDRRLSRKTRAAVGKPPGSATAARAVSPAGSPEAKGLPIGQPEAAATVAAVAGLPILARRQRIQFPAG